jgi:copper(I)-binding protein
MTLPKTFAFLLALTTLLAAGCGPGAPPEDAAAPAPPEPPPTGDALRAEDAWTLATPGSGTAAVYLKLLNPTPQDDLLVSVSTPAAKVAEVHETLDEGGMMRMRAFPEGMPVPARSTVVLEPGGKHIMLLALEKQLEPGQEVRLELHFKKAGTLAVTAPVGTAGP